MRYRAQRSAVPQRHLGVQDGDECVSYTPGSGDEATWGAYCGHPNDPRAPEYEDDFDWPEDDDEEGDEEECQHKLNT